MGGEGRMTAARRRLLLPPTLLLTLGAVLTVLPAGAALSCADPAAVSREGARAGRKREDEGRVNGDGAYLDDPQDAHLLVSSFLGWEGV